MKEIIVISLTFWIGWAMCYFTKSEDCYKDGYEAGKNYTPPAMRMIDSTLKGDKPDSVEVIIKNIYGNELNRVFKITGIIREE